MRANQKTQAKPQLPVYALYGEQQLQQDMDSLHCESIAERSRLHDWEIRPHRHAGLLQILYINSGRVQAQLEAASKSLRGPAVIVVPAGSVHGFRFTPDVQGLVATVNEAHAQALMATQAELAQAALAPRATPLRGTAATTLKNAAAVLNGEFLGHRRWRGLALDAALAQLLLALARLPTPAAEHAAPAGGRAAAHVQRFRALVDTHFRQQPSMAACAAQLAITPTQLNRVCQQVLGLSALAVLHARLLLEAQRELAYTGMSVKQIALGLGFADAAYFTRFFERRAGATPSHWRRARSEAA